MRVPVIPTILVTLAVATMVALGVWQLQRKQQKESEIAQLVRNLGKGDVAYPATGPLPEALLYRRSAVMCLRVASWDAKAGKSAKGESGYRIIAHCVTGAEGPGAVIALGVAPRWDVKPRFQSGEVHGWIIPAQEPSLIDRLLGRAERRPMLLASTPIAGLSANATPDPKNVPDNHLAYAIQWFVFASIAALIYVLALRRRKPRGALPG